MERKPAPNSEFGAGLKEPKIDWKADLPNHIVYDLVCDTLCHKPKSIQKDRYAKHSGLFVVRPTGFEPAAFRVGAERSIQLSYGRTSMKTVRRRISAIQL